MTHVHKVKVVGNITRKCYKISHTEIYSLLSAYSAGLESLKERKIEKSAKELISKYSKHHAIGTTSEVLACVLNIFHPVRSLKI